MSYKEKEMKLTALLPGKVMASNSWLDEGKRARNREYLKVDGGKKEMKDKWRDRGDQRFLELENRNV